MSSVMQHGTVLNCGGNVAHLHFSVVNDKGYRDKEALILGFFERSKIKVQAIAQSLGTRNCRVSYRDYKTYRDEKISWTGIFHPVYMGYDRFLYCATRNSEIGTKYLLTTEEKLNNDFHSFLMHNFKLPLLEWWTPHIIEELTKKRLIERMNLEINSYGNCEVSIPLNGENVNIQSLIGYFFDMSEEAFTEVISDMLASKKIWITKTHQNDLKFETFDDYIREYGPTLVANLEKAIEPLIGLKPNVDTCALKEKSLYPQQAACVNGMMALRDNGVNYAIANEGMGVGKVRRCGVRYDCNWNVA